LDRAPGVRSACADRIEGLVRPHPFHVPRECIR
jgi:hypothetical protein